MYSERRLCPRFSSHLPAQLNTLLPSNKAGLYGETLNLSQNGVQISCSSDVDNNVLKEAPNLQIKIMLPGKDKQIKILCRLVLTRRISENLYYLSFNFLEFLEQSETLLINYLSILQSN